MSGLILTVTDAGRAALVNASNTGTNPVLMASVGVSATSFSPSPATTILPDEIKRITTIAGEAVADNTIHVTVRDESADLYTVRSFGLYLADGTLFAVYSQASPIMEKSARALLLLAIDVIFADIEATDITFGDASFSNPPATTTRQGVVELATEAETETGSDAIRAVTPKGLKTAVTQWLNDRFGAGSPSAFIKGLLTSASAAALRTSLEVKSAALKDEGAGKGLDADLLDGAHGSFYRNADNLATGTVPTARMSGTYNISVSGNAATATKLATARTLSLSGDVTGSASFDGSANAGISVTLAAAKVLEKLRTVDGSGSGVDADTVDGLHASAFAQLSGATFTGAINISGQGLQRVGTPAGTFFGVEVNGNWLMRPGSGLFRIISADNSTTLFQAGTGGAHVQGNIVWHAGNDGAGSGLDADLLDGLHASAFARLTGGTFTGSINMAPGHGIQLDGKVALAGAGTTTWLYAQGSGGFVFRNAANNSNLVTISNLGNIHRLGNAVWDAGNDGSGSGLDADLLDGLHAVDFAKLADFVASKTTNGYCRLPNGMIIQAGRYSQSANTLINVAFPLAFPNLCMGVVTGGTGDASFGAEGNTPTVYSNSVTTGGFQSHNANDNAATAYFIAFGY